MFGILCFGDSITFGRGDTSTRGWVGRLAKYFESKDEYNVVFNLGIPGDSTTDLLERFEVECRTRIKRLHEGDRFVILVGIGTNDARFVASKKPQTSPEEFSENILNLIELAKKYTDEVMFVGLTPVDEEKTAPYEQTFFTNEHTKRYNELVRKHCSDQNILFIDIFNQWIQLDFKQWLADGLHPNSQGYEKMYESIKEFLIENKIID